MEEITCKGGLYEKPSSWLWGLTEPGNKKASGLNYGLLGLKNGLRWGIVAYDFGLLGLPGCSCDLGYWWGGGPREVESEASGGHGWPQPQNKWQAM